MPRGWKPKPTEAERMQGIADETARIIRANSALCGIRHDQDVAAGIGVSRSTFASKMKSGTFTQKDLIKIIAFLKIPATDAAKMLGVSL